MSLTAVAPELVLVVAAPVLVLLMAVLVFGAMRRREADDVIGRLSRETLSRDKAHGGRARGTEAPRA
ncbi:MAG: hypothetical protein ACRD0A_21040, partial [Acidimicrobiales bacterium]